MTYLFFFIIMFVFFSPNVYAYNLFSVENFLSHTYHSVNTSLSSQTLFFLTLLVILPFVIFTMTCFTRIVVILGFLKNSIGMPCSPPNQILISISLFLTFFIMQPVFHRIYSNSYIPFINNQINIKTAINKGLMPLKQFMSHQTKQSDLLMFSKLMNIKLRDHNINHAPIRVLVPSFMISELKFAFKIGLTIFLPFLIIDLLVSSVLMLLGMMMIPPATISIPLKLIIFICANGWTLLISSLAFGFYS
ncbi:flagellar type III secretion system pore protein FliP [Buchnera aphidicola]|uniref:flagellar type III secretion system pore protein FliP n=1 Tax=Buchnera aphidicola TaxID=9 RepID=UPI0022377A41|nr:flagellar type III secretion system pore protein FliP [Buchnera aphidicola]MCW5197592.1 flagellar type III secretion system pore protein FliP [Buchnera aphidicola (Chaitophorus viminalis)]